MWGRACTRHKTISHKKYLIISFHFICSCCLCSSFNLSYKELMYFGFFVFCTPCTVYCCQDDENHIQIVYCVSSKSCKTILIVAIYCVMWFSYGISFIVFLSSFIALLCSIFTLYTVHSMFDAFVYFLYWQFFEFVAWILVNCIIYI